MPDIDWSNINAQVIAGLITAAILATVGWASGLFRWLRGRRVPSPPGSRPGVPASSPVTVSVGDSAPQGRSVASDTTSSADSLTELELEVLGLFGRLGRNQLEVFVFARELKTTEIRLRVATERLMRRNLVTFNKGSFARMIPPHLTLTSAGSNYLVEHGLA